MKDKNNADALYARAMCFYYQDIPDRALQFFAHALRVDPDHKKSRQAIKVIATAERLLEMGEGEGERKRKEREREGLTYTHTHTWTDTHT